MSKIYSDNIIQIDNILYSTDKLAKNHPGGKLFVEVFGGKDATNAFMSYHRRLFPHSKMIFAKLLTLEDKNIERMDPEYIELSKIIEQVISRNNSFADFNYYLKVFFLLLFTLSFELYTHYTSNYYIFNCTLIGFLYALIGLNIQHDANHGAISKNPNINRILGLTQNYIGGSAINWIHQHVVQHHIYTNDVNDDPDIMGSDILRLNPLQKILPIHSYQYIYTFLIIGLFGFVTVINCITNLKNGVIHTPMSSYTKIYRLREIFGSIFFIFRWIILPLNSNNNIYSLLNTVPLYIVAGYYLAFFFIISHNYEGVVIFDKNSKYGFLRQQIMSSSNVGGNWLCFINGGLNYQIEHHLFPRISHVHYPKISHVVKKYCISKNIPYKHFPSIYDNFVSCSKHLYNMGNKLTIKTD